MSRWARWWLSLQKPSELLQISTLYRAMVNWGWVLGHETAQSVIQCWKDMIHESLGDLTHWGPEHLYYFSTLTKSVSVKRVETLSIKAPTRLEKRFLISPVAGGFLINKQTACCVYVILSFHTKPLLPRVNNNTSRCWQWSESLSVRHGCF